ncbi:MAG: AbgT family transporter [Desulfobacterales bacterium]|nr:AbgT family transporter [Desulfobacterales bacterium]
MSGGYSANLLLGTIDPLLAGLTQEAARIVDPAYRVNPAANYYFMAASTFLDRVGRDGGSPSAWSSRGSAPWTRRAADASAVEPLTPAGAAGPPLRVPGGRPSLAAARPLAASVPDGGFLRDPETGDVLHSPFLIGHRRVHLRRRRARRHRLRRRRRHGPRATPTCIEGDEQVDGDAGLATSCWCSSPRSSSRSSTGPTSA